MRSHRDGYGLVQLRHDAWVFYPSYPPLRGYVFRSAELRDTVRRTMERCRRALLVVFCATVAVGVTIGGGAAGGVVAASALFVNVLASVWTRRLVRQMVALSIPLSLGAYALAKTPRELYGEAWQTLVLGLGGIWAGLVGADPLFLADAVIFALWSFVLVGMIVWRRRELARTKPRA